MYGTLKHVYMKNAVTGFHCMYIAFEVSASYTKVDSRNTMVKSPFKVSLRNSEFEHLNGGNLTLILDLGSLKLNV
jgi:hypothetical protein